MIFTPVAVTPHRLVYDLTAEATPDSGTRTNAEMLADAIPGSPLARFLAETSPDFLRDTVTQVINKDVVGEWAVDPQLDGGNLFEVPVECDTDTATSTLIITYVHSMVR